MISRERNSRGQVSLARAISKLGIASRTEAEQLIRKGRVAVNEHVVRTPGIWLDLRTDRISIDGKPAGGAAPVYLLMNKPAGVVTTRRDERNRQTVFDVLPAGTPQVFPIGRLDKETSGMLLFTNDVRFGNLLTDPEHHVSKRYCVTLTQHPLPDHIALWKRGMTLRDGTQLRPAIVQQDGSDAHKVMLTITEGKNRQVRRMMEECGFTIVSLVRTGIGPLDLGSLKEGEVRVLTADERRSFLGAGSVAGSKGQTA